MRRLVMLAATAISAATLLAGATGAGADPVGSKNSFILPTSCGTVVLNSANGNSQNPQAGQWSSAKFLDSNKIFVGVELHSVFTLTPTGGPTVTQAQDVVKNGPNQPTTTCTFDVTGTFPLGTFTLTGSARGVIH